MTKKKKKRIKYIEFYKIVKIRKKYDFWKYKKMTGKIENNVVNYLLPIGNENFNMNTLIGKILK